MCLLHQTVSQWVFLLCFVPACHHPSNTRMTDDQLKQALAGSKKGMDDFAKLSPNAFLCLLQAFPFCLFSLTTQIAHLLTEIALWCMFATSRMKERGFDLMSVFP